MAYGATLRDARLAAGLTLEATADKAGCSTSYVHKLELGRVKTPSPRVLERLARALELDYGRLMQSAGYHMGKASSPGRPAGPRPAELAADAPSNATILRVLLDVRRDVAGIKAILSQT